MKIIIACILLMSCKSINEGKNLSNNHEEKSCFNADVFLAFQNDIMESSKWQNHIDFKNEKIPVSVLLSFNSNEEIDIWIESRRFFEI